MFSDITHLQKPIHADVMLRIESTASESSTNTENQRTVSTESGKSDKLSSNSNEPIPEHSILTQDCIIQAIFLLSVNFNYYLTDYNTTTRY